MGVPPISGEPAITDLIRRFRGLFSQNFFGPLKNPVGRNLARPFVEKVGRLPKTGGALFSKSEFRP